MKKEILDSLPHISIAELINVRDYFKEITSDNINLITRREHNDDSVLCEFIENHSKYAFVVRDFKYDSHSGKNIYSIYRRPESINNMIGAESSGNFDNIKKLFSRWIADCKVMNEIKFKFLNPDNDFYDNEFSEFFSNDDSDASQNPFELKRQEILFYFLTYAERKVANDNSIEDKDQKELLYDLSKLKEDIPKETKKVFVHRLSKFAQKAKKVSNKLFHDIFDVLKKELIKKVLYEGAEQIPNVVSKIESWIALLGHS